MSAVPQNESDILLSVRGIVNRFGAQLVHDGVSFDVRKGEIVGVVGGSGAGKSVLLKTLIGLRAPDEGEVIIAGKKIGALKPRESAALLGVLFQEGALFSSLTVAENIMLPLKEHTTLTAETRALLAAFKLALVRFPPDAATKYPSELSGGMTKRAALARALAMDPPLLFLDEPTSGLDPVNAAAFDDLILDLNRGLGVTVILITHDLDTLFRICDRVAVLNEGKVLIDRLSKLREIDEPWIQEFFHGPRAEGAMMAARSAHGAS